MTLKLEITNFTGGDFEPCVMCGDGRATRSFKVQEFEYGRGQDAVTLHARVPVWSCDDCDTHYVDEEGERAQHDAVCRHLGRLTPTEIKAIRVGTKLSQVQFAEELHVGVASLKRWEAGSLIQRRAADVSIRELQIRWKQQNRPEPSFRTQFSDAQRAAASMFNPRTAQSMQQEA